MNKYLTILLLIFLGFAGIIGLRLILEPKSIETGKTYLQGDANIDGKVDILDFQLLSNSFGKASGQTAFDGRCDFNSDARVDILDFQLLSNNFGKTTPATSTVTPRPTATPTPRPSATTTPRPTDINTPTPTIKPFTGPTNYNFIVDKDNIGGKGCSDTGIGDLAKPFCTITKAVSAVQPGQVIGVRRGTYPSIEISKSGSSGVYITIVGYQDERPLISGGTAAIRLNGKSYIRIKGFEITGATGSYSGGVAMLNSAHHNIIESNIIHDNSGQSTMGVSIINSSQNTVLNNTIYNNYSCGVRVGGNGTDNQIIGNTIYGHSGSTGGSDGIAVTEQTKRSLVKNNIVYNNSDDGIDTWSSSGNTIVGNIVHGHRGGGDGNGFKMGGTESGGNNTVIGNVSYNNKRDGFDSNHSYGNIYYHNVAFGNSGVGFEDVNKFANCVHSRCGTILINNIGMNNGRNLSAGPHTATSHNNIWYSGTGGASVYFQGKEVYSTLSAFYAASGNRLDNPNGGTLSSFSVNPLFVNSGSGNFHINSGSPAINKGDPGNPAGIQVSGVPDIGAYEYGI